MNKITKEMSNEKEVQNQEIFKMNKLSVVLHWIRKAKIINKRTCKLLIMLLLILGLTNPDLIPFLPTTLKDTWLEIVHNLLGDVSEISEILPINRIVLVQIIVMLIFLGLIKEIIKAILENIQFSNKRLQTFSTVFLSTMRYLFTIIAIVWALKIMGVNTTAIFAGVGIVSLIVGFSAESLIADMITGIFLLFDNQYNIGDIIDVGAFHGEVVKIGFRSTALRDQGGNIKIINNSNMRDITNRSNEKSMALCDIVVPSNIDISIVEDGIDLVLEKLKEDESIFLETPEYWGIEALKGKEMVLRIVAWVDERNVYRAQRLINRAIKQKLQNTGVWG